jgi:UDPglucose 6-dehydrogenase
MKLVMVGTGYVGLVSGACFAERGIDVICVDLDKEKVERLKEGVVPFYEPGLDVVVKQGLRDGNLSFTTSLKQALVGADVVFVAVGTPSRSDGSADLTQVDAVVRSVLESMTGPLILVNKSTVPVGTNERVRKIVADRPVKVVSNPEFLREGSALEDFRHPDRVVIGCDTSDMHVVETMTRVYGHVYPHKMIWMDPVSAELTKYVANTMLAMRISFMNEVSRLCASVGGDVQSVQKGVGSDPRIGSQFLKPGPGYGGSCFPKDVKALVHTGRERGVTLHLAEATELVNLQQKCHLVRHVKQALGADLRGKKVALWGLSFKPQTDDTRDSSALFLIDALLADGVKVVAHDPAAMENVRAAYGDKVELVEDPLVACSGASVLVLVTEWACYNTPHFHEIFERLESPNLIDTRALWKHSAPWRLGFNYWGPDVIRSAVN